LKELTKDGLVGRWCSIRSDTKLRSCWRNSSWSDGKSFVTL